MGLLGRRRGGVASAGPPAELLGSVTCPTGDLLVLDFGLMELWSGDKPPLLEGGTRLVPESLAEQANAAADFEIVGPDAAAVAGQIDLAVVMGRYAFDARADAALLTERIDAARSSSGLQATLRRIDRMPHRQRLLRLLDDRPGGAEVPFHGMWGVALRGVPTDRPMPVRGRRMDPDGPDSGRWHSVWVECDGREPVATVGVGYVLVDEARLLFTDPLALNSWRDDESLDGFADLVFWGRDAAAVADRTGAVAQSSAGDGEVYGWVDRPVEEILELGQQLEVVRADPEVAFAMDFRPHDDHYRLLSQAWRSPTESGTIAVGGSAVTGFFTTWGDGAFPVYRDVAADGALCRFRVELGAPEIVERARRMEELWFGELSKMALASARVIRDGQPVRWLYRQLPDRPQDSGWRVFAGDESDEYSNAEGNCVVVPLRTLIEGDPALEELFRAPSPAAYERRDEGPFVAVDYTPQDD